VFRVARTADRAAVRDVLLRASEGPYPLDRVIDEKLREGFRGDPVLTLAFAGSSVAGAAVTCGEYLRMIGVPPAGRRQGAGSALLDEAERRIAENSEGIVVAAEPGNYFTPGVREPDAGFFLRRGYSKTAVAVNLTAPTVLRTPGRVRRAGSADRDRLLDFVGSFFGRIWRFETSRAFEHERPTVAFIEEHGTILGFAAWCANNAALGTYGPAGTAPDQRNRGLGRELLWATLSEMHAEGFESALIQWAAALPFYERSAGARPQHRFVVLEKRLRP
jgi:GNAT superfamily N-acetyltransferase